MEVTDVMDLHGDEDDHGIDLYAIRLVVREGCKVPLTQPERVIAAHLMKRKGFMTEEMADRLQVTCRAVVRYGKRVPAIPIDQIPPFVTGNLVCLSAS